MLHALESRGTWISSAKPALGRSGCVFTSDEHLVEWVMTITGGAGVPAAIDIDTDVILPGHYLSLTDPAQLAQHVFAGVDPDFVKRVRPGDILVAGRNFGSGSSREHAPIGRKARGLSCVIAASFARIFYRNAINLGLPILICPDAARAARPGDHVRADSESGLVEVAGQRFSAQPFPPFLQELIQAGGLVEWVRGELARRQTA